MCLFYTKVNAVSSVHRLIVLIALYKVSVTLYEYALLTFRSHTLMLSDNEDCLEDGLPLFLENWQNRTCNVYYERGLKIMRTDGQGYLPCPDRCCNLYNHNVLSQFLQKVTSV